MLNDFLAFREFRVENAECMSQTFVRRIIIQFVRNSIPVKCLGKIKGIPVEKIVVTGYEIARWEISGNFRILGVRVRRKRAIFIGCPV